MAVSSPQFRSNPLTLRILVIGLCCSALALASGSILAQTLKAGAKTTASAGIDIESFNNSYRPQLEAAGLVISGRAAEADLVEFVELPRSVHPYYVATQAHPVFLSRPCGGQPQRLEHGLDTCGQLCYGQPGKRSAAVCG